MSADLDVHWAGIVAGDTAAFARWMAAAEPCVRRSLTRYAARVDCEVLVQETLLRCWQVAPRVVADGRANALLRLALRTARNLALDELRRSRRLASEDDADFEDAVQQPEEPDQRLRDAIAACVRHLPPKPAQALFARIRSAGGEPDEMIAQELSMRLNTFHQNLARARALLSECLRRAGVDWQGARAR